MVRVAALIGGAVSALRRRAPGRARIRRVDLVRYIGPGRALVHSHGLVAVVTATDGEREVRGVGEAIAAPAHARAAWRRLQAAAPELVDAVVPHEVDPADPLARFAGWQPVRPSDSGPVRAAKLALETALLSLLGHLGALPAAGPVSPVAPQRVHRLPRALPGSAADDLTPVLTASEGDNGWALRLRLTGDDELDLAWLAHVTTLEREAGRRRPVWLSGGARRPETAATLVRRMADLIAADRAPSLVLLEEPLVRPERSRLGKYRERSVLARLGPMDELCRLQRLADRALGRSPGSTDGPRLAVVAGDSVSTLHQVRRLCRGWPVGGLHLSLPHWGTLQGMREAARLARRADPATVVLLGGGRGSRLTAAALEWLAATTPEIDRYAPEEQPVEWPDLHRPDATGAGPVGGVDLAELATVADALATFPPAPAARTGAPRPNRFPEDPLPGEPVGRRTMLLETEALRAGLRTRRLSREVLLAEHPVSGVTVGFTDSESCLTGLPAAVACHRKDVTRQLLSTAGLPVPPGAAVPPGRRDEAYRVARELGFPLVVKPSGGSKGTAVTVGITSEEELERALDAVDASPYAHTGTVVERQVTGREYRIFATRDEVLSVVWRRPASVVGDGRRTVTELVMAANAVRRGNPHLATRVIRLDARVDELLQRQGLTRDSVPEAGRRVKLREEGNFSLGGESTEVLAETHPSVCELAVAAVRAVPGLAYAGLDILMTDHRLPVDEQEMAILEVNSRPVQSIHHFPMYGPPRPVSRRLVHDALAAGGVEPPVAADELSVRVAIRGRVQGVGYRRWIQRAARRLGVTGWVRNAPDPTLVEAVVCGPAQPVGMLLRLAYDGPPGASVVEVAAEPADLPAGSGFHIR